MGEKKKKGSSFAYVLYVTLISVSLAIASGVAAYYLASAPASAGGGPQVEVTRAPEEGRGGGGGGGGGGAHPADPLPAGQPGDDAVATAADAAAHADKKEEGHSTEIAAGDGHAEQAAGSAAEAHGKEGAATAPAEGGDGAHAAQEKQDQDHAPPAGGH